MGGSKKVTKKKLAGSAKESPILPSEWKFVSRGAEWSSSGVQTMRGTKNKSKKRRYTPLDCVNPMLSKEILELITSETNKHMANKKSNKISQQSDSDSENESDHDSESENENNYDYDSDNDSKSENDSNISEASDDSIDSKDSSDAEPPQQHHPKR
mgnify:CR=1 FL=1